MITLTFLQHFLGGIGLLFFVSLLFYFGARKRPELGEGSEASVREVPEADTPLEAEITREAEPFEPEWEPLPTPSFRAFVWLTFMRLPVFPTIR